jgi:hypothetical protein
MSQRFIDYMMDFYGPDSEIYPELGFNETQIAIALGIYKMRLEVKGDDFCGDSIDRENVRDIILEARKNVLPEFAKA